MKRGNSFATIAAILITLGMLISGVAASGAHVPVTTNPLNEEGKPPDVLEACKQAKIDWRKYEGTTLNALVVMHWWTNAIKPLLPQFEELTGMKVKLDILSEDTYFQKAVTELSAGSGAHDVLMVGNLQVGQYMNSGCSSLWTHI